MIKNAILDTCVLVLLVVGVIDKKYIAKYTKTKAYTENNFDSLSEKLGGFEKLIVTPHILTEFSHHTIEHKDFRDDYKKKVKDWLLGVSGNGLEERESRMDPIFNNARIYYLGVADVSLAEICDTESVVITSDGRLADKLREDGKNALKFLPTIGFADY